MLSGWKMSLTNIDNLLRDRKTDSVLYFFYDMWCRFGVSKKIIISIAYISSVYKVSMDHYAVHKKYAYRNSWGVCYKQVWTSCRRAAATICPAQACNGSVQRQPWARSAEPGRAGPDQPIRAIQPAGRTRRPPTGCTLQTSDKQTSDSIIA